MITIKINKTKVNIFTFDNSQSIFKRYILTLKDRGSSGQKGLLPTVDAFLRFDNEPVFFKANENYTISDVRDDLIKNKNIKQLINDSETIYALDKLAIKYPRIDKQHLILLYIIVKGYDIPSGAGTVRVGEANDEDFSDIYENELYEELSRFHIRAFSSKERLLSALEQYRKTIALASKHLEKSLIEETKSYDFFEKYKGPITEPFNISEISESSFLHLPTGESLYDIFDSFDVSEHCPFLVLVDGNKKYYKMYQEFMPPDEWIYGNGNGKTGNTKVSGDVSAQSEMLLHFYISSMPHVKSLWPRTDTEENFEIYSNLYSKGTWNAANVVKLESTGKFNSTGVIREKLFSRLKIRFEVIDTIQTNIKGTFVIPNVVLNKGVFCELMMNDDHVKYFLFADESKNSSLEKPRFTFYFETNQQGDPAKALTITVASVIENKRSYVNVRVSKAKSLRAIETFTQTFKSIFGYYEEKYDKVVDLYSALYPKVNFEKFTIKKTIERHDTKTGERLEALKQYNFEAFGKGKYSTKCQTGKQPYLVKSKDILRIKKEFENIKDEKKRQAMLQHGLINWPLGSDDYYACYPRESAKDKKKFEWPGLVCLNDRDFRPCCFQQDQYVKKGSGINEYTKTGNLKCGEGSGTVISRAITRPLNSDKHVEPGKLGDLPYYVQVLALYAGYRHVDVKNKQSLPILRYGVMDGPDSFFHCIYAALNPGYFSMTIGDKKKEIRKELDLIANGGTIHHDKSNRDINKFLHIGKQELYDYSYEDIREILTTEESYIDSDMFVTIFEKYFEPCNIIVFKRDIDSLRGEFSPPRANLFRARYKPDLREPEYDEKKENENTIVIVKFQTDSGEYQCELVIKYDKGNFNYVFSPEDPFIKACFKAINDSNNLYVTSYERLYKKVEPMVTIHQI